MALGMAKKKKKKLKEKPYVASYLYQVRLCGNLALFCLPILEGQLIELGHFLHMYC